MKKFTSWEEAYDAKMSLLSKHISSLATENKKKKTNPEHEVQKTACEFVMNDGIRLWQESTCCCGNWKWKEHKEEKKPKPKIQRRQKAFQPSDVI